MYGGYIYTYGLASPLRINLLPVFTECHAPWWVRDSQRVAIRLFRIMSIPITFRLFRVMTSEMLGRLLPVFTLLLRRRQHIIVVDAVDYK